jgi:hypothetical protein
MAQSKSVTASDYNSTFQNAVYETNRAFPFIFTVVTEEFDNGKVVFSETMINERQTAGVERISRTILENGKKSTIYQVKIGFGNVYCSNDGVTWHGPQKSECSGPRRLYGQREVESSQYSVEEKSIDGETVKVYREYLIYSPSQSGRGREFKETIATIDSRGFFISILNNEGRLDPKVVTLVRTQTWDFKTKIKPFVAPK